MKLLSKIVGWFKKVPEDLAPNTVWIQKDHGSWGNNISTLSWSDEGIRLSGHTRPRPVENDLLLVSMSSGKTAVVRLTNMDYVRDPNDMWFAEGEPINYVEDMNEETKDSLGITEALNASEPKTDGGQDDSPTVRVLKYPGA